MKTTIKKIMMSFLFLSGVAKASVNLQTGGWFWKIPIQELELTYNSRSLHQGWWGQGWCSDLDARLQKISGASFNFIYCSQKEPAAVLETENGFKVHFEKKDFYFNKEYILEKVESSSHRLQILWKDHLINGLQMDGALYEVTTNHSLISNIKDHLNSWSFKFEKGFLMEFAHGNPASKKWASQLFSYDEFDNMERITEGQNTLSEKVTLINYTNKDQVRQVLAPNQCKSTYTFDQIKGSKQLTLFSRIEKLCFQNGPTNSLKSVISQFQVEKDQQLKLTQVKEMTL